VGGGVLVLGVAAAVAIPLQLHLASTDAASAGAEPPAVGAPAEPADGGAPFELPAPVEVPATVVPPAAARPEHARQAPPAPAAAPAASGWTLRWSPEARRDGLKAFEGVEDDRKDSHRGARHISVQGNNFRFDMHRGDRDGSDRQRNEVKGMRAGSSTLTIAKGQTWRITYSMFIPSSLKATTSFTHIMQTKMPGNGTAPIMVMSLRKHAGTPTIELKATSRNGMVGSTNLAPLQNTWIDTEVEFTSDDAPRGRIRWVLKRGGTTVLDVQKSGIDTWLGDRVRPKWGIYRSLNDAGAIQDTHLLLTNLKAYQRTGTG